MPTKYQTGHSTKLTTHIQMPLTNKGTSDKRYSCPQFCNKNGTKDMRTNNIKKK